jgi:DNA-binding MltR family transcriptional regulator
VGHSAKLAATIGDLRHLAVRIIAVRVRHATVMQDVQMPLETSRPTFLSNFTFKQYIDLLDDLEKDGPRGAVLLGHAVLESAMRDLLISRMLPLNRREDDALFGGYGPLSTMAARISVARAFNIITKEARQNLDTIRQIRNCFAHTDRRIDFDDPKVVALCEKLAIPTRLPKDAASRRKLYVEIVRSTLTYIVSHVSPDAASGAR